MFEYTRPVWAEINVDNLKHNINEIKRVSKSKEIMGIIKADAYGHSAIETAKILNKNGVNYLAVAVITEALELRREGIKSSILVLGFTVTKVLREVIENDIILTAYSYEYIKELNDEAKKIGGKVKIHIAVDTGMGRIGFLPTEQSIKEVYECSKLPNIQIEGVFSHFANSDETDKSYTNYQVNKFNSFCRELEKLGVNFNIKHIANSGAIIDLPEFHYDAVRPGIILFGYYPSKEVKINNINLKPVLSLKANVTFVKTVNAGEYIGYGRTYKTDKETVIATIPIGYADGYSRALSNRGKVIIKGQYAPIIGRVCMDQCMVDVTNISGVENGDEVILLGEDNNIKISADDLAETIGTINYEVLCMISKRVPRVFLENSVVDHIRNYI